MATKMNLSAVNSEGAISTPEAVEAATKETGLITYSPYSVFPIGTEVSVAPIGDKCFGLNEHLTFRVGSREYTDQRGLFVYLNDSTEPTPVHFTGAFRSRPSVSNTGDDDFLQQLLEHKITFIKKGFTADGVRVYDKNPVPCTYFDDTTDINYLRMSREKSDWAVIQALAGHRWKVIDMVIAETRQFRKGLPPRQIFMNIPILKRIGVWDER